MRLLISWARDFVDIAASPEEIAEMLALRGFEVASVEAVDPNDAVIDFEVTANRPDCLSVAGLAREIATAYQLPFRAGGAIPGASGAHRPLPLGESDRLKVSIDDGVLCPRYAAAVADIVPVSSPAWMTSRLQAAGIRPISPIVDITNYVLIETGQPMHAFDLASIEGGALRVRRALPGERLTTLDGVERTLDAEMLVIADAARAQAVAGVMGGAASEVSARTRSVAFESAYFSPVSVRRTSKRLGLKTEASARFERGADVNAPVIALQRALALMQAIGAGAVAGPIVDRYPAPVGPTRLHLRRERLARVLGLRVPDRDVERILTALGLATTEAADGWDVVAPTVRVDLSREVDLIEEVGRHYGFEKLEAAFPVLTAPAQPADPRIGRDHLVRRVLTAVGFSEAVTFGFVESEAAARFAGSGGPAPVGVANPLSAKFDVLRPSLLPGLVDAVAHNRRHGRRDVALFEIGARFHQTDGETRGVALAWTGAPVPEHWSVQAREIDFFDIKGSVETLCDTLGVAARFAPAAPPFLVAGQAADVLVGEATVGVVGLVSTAVSESRGVPRHDKVFVAELNLDRLWSLRPQTGERVRALPRYPFVVRDVSIVVPDALPAATIRGTIQAASERGPAPLSAIGFFDRYKGKGVADDVVSLSVRLTFQAPDRTLTDQEVQQSVEAILAALGRDHGALQR